eukprot:TRINITY_DN16599_c0_g1_i2.p1 TRINITY_DN16599_c0_g1~~TRINITY_DN16599_c0_g1_i2.p1  ORF type:complete len:165 (-),score=38.92 TRINITY_DN16599_c0_g1_i2:261-755(-)
MSSVLVLENDVRLMDGFRELLSHAVAKLPVEWDMLMLDALSMSVAQAIMDPAQPEGWFPCTNCTLSGGYIINRMALEQLLNALQFVPQMLTEELLIGIQSQGKCHTHIPLFCVQEMMDTTVQSDVHMDTLRNFYALHYYSRFGDRYKDTLQLKPIKETPSKEDL